jgi:hypothetical protein
VTNRYTSAPTAVPIGGKTAGKNGAPSPVEHPPKSSDKLGGKLSRQRYE